MLARVYSCAVIGLDGVVVEVEVDYTSGFPGMTIVGLPDAAIQESRERVQAAVRNAGVPFPRKRLVVNLAPASVRKEGPAYDLPIALGVLIYTGMLPAKAALIPDLEVIPVGSLVALYDHLACRKPILVYGSLTVEAAPLSPPTDFGEVKGQEQVKRIFK
jgi:magnesium chelatase family protein